MTLSRRDVLRRGLCGGAAMLGAQGASLRSLFASEGAVRNLVFVELDGGNDGLNTIVPHGVDGGLYAAHYRPQLHVPAASVLPIDEEIGFNPNLAPLQSLWESGRLAVIQGVGSPLPTFSHDFAKKVWATGDPTGETTTGWLGRYLATLPKNKSRAYDVASFADDLFAGAKQFVPAFPSLDGLKFPTDKKHPNDAWARKQAFEVIHAMHAQHGDALLAELGATGERLLSVLSDYSGVKSVSHAGKYPNHALGKALQTVVRLLKSKLGLRYHHVVFEGFDTHGSQDSGFSHDQRLGTLALALAAFQKDLEKHGLAKDTLVVVYSEFGRALYENASRGTDHGTAAPVLVLGDRVVGGLHREHPSLRLDAISGDGEMIATTDYRDVLGTIAMRWIETDPTPLFPGHVVADLGFVS
jgi:uncharacterized protein (DUF1501 family)